MDGLRQLRFLAFAFAGSDILLEVDQTGCITFGAGMTTRLLGVKAARLEGASFANLFPLDERPTVAEMMARLTAGERISGMRLSLLGSDDTRVAVAASGMTAMKGGGAMQIALRRRDSGRPLSPSNEPADAARFAALVAERAVEADLAGDPCVLSVLQLPGGPTGGIVPQALGRLRAWTLWGDSLLELPGNRVALVHSGRLTPDHLEQRLAELIGGDAATLGVMCIDCTPTAPELLPALRLELDRLAAGQPLAAVLLSQALRNAARAAAAPVAALRSAISRTDIALLFQPVVNLRHWTVHHYEALARIGRGETQQPPARFLRDAAERGMAADLDLAICRAVVRALDDADTLPASAHVSINLSAVSVAMPGFSDALLGVLGSNPRVLDRLLIEIGGLDRRSDLETIAGVLRPIRDAGCRVTLDDLLAGGPDLMAVQRLHPDFVKVDVLCLREPLKGRAGIALLRALSRLCDDLGIGLIAKRIEEDTLVGPLCELSIHLGQGFCFAKPQRAFPKGFKPRRPALPAVSKPHGAAKAARPFSPLHSTTFERTR